jgi:hypothetical protein
MHIRVLLDKNANIQNKQTLCQDQSIMLPRATAEKKF